MPVKVLLISDGRPGHFRLAEGIVAAAERRRPVELQRIECRRGRWPGLVLAGISNSALADTALLRSVYGLAPPAPGAYDLVVSAGAETLAANVACARLSGAKNVFYGSLRAFRPASFSLVLTSYIRNASRPRHRMMLKPSAIPRTARPPMQRGPDNAPQTGVLLLGGDAGTTRFEADDWRRLLAFVSETHASSGMRWLISNSRRTPAVASALIAQQIAGQATGGPILRFIDVRNPDTATLAAAFAEADVVVCTDDSSSMISEAIAAGLPTVGVRPRDHRLPVDEAGYRDYLITSGWHRVLDISALTAHVFLDAVAQITPLAADPLDLLAVQLGDALPEILA
jgi:uncharacterized protein